MPPDAVLAQSPRDPGQQRVHVGRLAYPLLFAQCSDMWI
jgi:hypothetical protein